MHAIERANRYNGMLERGQTINMSEDFHQMYKMAAKLMILQSL
jgi:hypothetical protein